MPAGKNDSVNSGGNIVYSSAYDGYVVIRNCPSLQCAAIGKFPNGPTGATYLGEDSGWTQINYNGIIGWVNSTYVTRTPTKEVTVDVDGNVLEGIWTEDGYSYYLIFDNGYYMQEWDTSSGGSVTGHYYMEGDSIFFVPDTYDLPDYIVPSVEEYKIVNRTIENLERVPYVSEEDAKLYDEEGYGGSLWWTKKQFRKLKSKTY